MLGELEGTTVKEKKQDMPRTSKRKAVRQYVDATVQEINSFASGISAFAVIVTLVDIPPSPNMLGLEFVDSTGNVSSKSIY